MPATKHRPATIVEVARRAGVSPATVSRVLNGTAAVTPETELRVRTAIGDLHFSPHPAARQLLHQPTRALGLLLPEISGEFFPPLLRGIESAGRAAGYDLLIHAVFDSSPPDRPTSDQPSPNRPYRRPLTERNTDGLLIFPGSVEEVELRRLAQIGFPVVLLHQLPPSGVDLPTVTVENEAGAEALVNHLIERHGRRRVVYLQGPLLHEDSHGREQGYRKALAAHDLPFDPTLVRSGGFDDQIAFQAVQGLLAEGVDFDALFTGNDEAALGAMRALKLAGRSIPGAVAVVGFDDISFASYTAPTLTTMRSPIEGVGRKAVQQLVRLIHAEPVERVITMPTELIVRESCGCLLGTGEG